MVAQGWEKLSLLKRIVDNHDNQNNRNRVKFNISELGLQLGINWLEIARGRIWDVPVGGRKSVKC